MRKEEKNYFSSILLGKTAKFDLTGKKVSIIQL